MCGENLIFHVKFREILFRNNNDCFKYWKTYFENFIEKVNLIILPAKDAFFLKKVGLYKNHHLSKILKYPNCIFFKNKLDIN